MWSDWDLGQRASWAVPGVVHGLVMWVIWWGGMQWYTTWIGKVGLGHWGMSGLSGDSEEGLGVVSDFLGYTECRFSR